MFDWCSGLHLFLSIFLSLLSFFIILLSTTNSLDFHMVSSPLVTHNKRNTQQVKPQRNRKSRHFFFWHVSIYTHTPTPHKRNRSCRNATQFFTHIFQFFLPINTAIYLYVLLILHLILWLTFERWHILLPTTSTLTSIQVLFPFTFPPSHSLFFYTPCFCFLSLVCLSVCLFI